MPKIFAFRTEPWTEFAKDKDSIFEQDFVKDKILTFKTTLKPLKGIVKLKQMIQYERRDFMRSQEIKIWFPFKKQGSSLYTLIAKNQAKIRYDHGFRSYGNNLFDFYGGVESEKNFKNIIMKLGANVLFVDSNFDSRLRVAFTDAGTNQVSLGHKFNWSQGKWSVDLCKVFNLGSFSLFKNSLRVIYRHNSDNQLFFKAENLYIRKFSSIDLTSLDTYYTDFTLDYIRKIDDLTVVGLQTCFSRKNKISSSLVAQRAIDQWNSKAKIRLSSNRSVSMSIQSQIRDYGRWVFGWEISDIGNKNNTRFGLLVDLNL